MSGFDLTSVGQLADQLARGPVRLRLRQLAGIDFLLSVIEPDKTYPFAFVRHALTGYRMPFAETNDADELLSGAPLRDDLVLLAELLSESAGIPLQTWPTPIFSVTELADRFGVSTKTIFRWRKRGLVGWKFRGPDRRLRLAFPDHCVRRFVAENVDLVNRGSSFSQLTANERTAIIDRAKELVAVGERTVNAVARTLCDETGRAIETIRLILKHYDEAHPKQGLFNRTVTCPGADDRSMALWEAYVDGASIETLAKRFERPVRTIYRQLTELRARDTKSRPIEFVPSDEFLEPGIGRTVASDPNVAAPYAEDTRAKKAPRDLPPYLQQLFRLPLLTPAGEAALFRKMNYLKFRADELRAQIEPETTTAADLDRIEQLLDDANAIKNQILNANLRLVVSIAKKHANPMVEFFEVVSDGNISLMRAVERFDYSRGFKFSTYASWAIMKNYARSAPEQRRRQDRYQTGRDELLSLAPAPNLDDLEDDYLPALRNTLDRMLDSLDEREQTILRQRYGLDRAGGDTATLEEIGKRFGVSKERIRQLEARALSKLRTENSESVLENLG